MLESGQVGRNGCSGHLPAKRVGRVAPGHNTGELVKTEENGDTLLKYFTDRILRPNLLIRAKAVLAESQGLSLPTADWRRMVS